VFSVKFKEVKSEPTEAQLQEKQMDYYRGVRTGVVLIWMITNFALAAVVLSSAGLERITPGDEQDLENQQTERSNIYMAVVLWSVAALSSFKFLGAMWFLIVRLFRGV
jgi:chitin synthase